MRPATNALSAALVFSLVACSGAAQSVRRQTPTDVVATVGSSAIALAELDNRALSRPAGAFGRVSLAQALYEARRAVLDEIVGNRLIDLEAKARGIDRTELVEREITAKVSVSDGDVAQWYAANQARVEGRTLEQASALIRPMLVAERTETARTAYLDRLQKNTAVTITLEPTRFEVAEAGRPAKGPAKAPVQIIEFSDFECSYCLRAGPTVAQVLSTYGDRIRFVYRHYPLPNHPNARPSAEASACAEEQGRFWEYHDRLFANQSQLGSDDLKRHAAELGLEAEKFNTCFDSRTYQKRVEADIDAANAAGVSGTPAFFINGRMLSGAQPFERFKSVIDEELSRQKR